MEEKSNDKSTCTMEEKSNDKSTCTMEEKIPSLMELELEAPKPLPLMEKPIPMPNLPSPFVDPVFPYDGIMDNPASHFVNPVLPYGTINPFLGDGLLPIPNTFPILYPNSNIQPDLRDRLGSRIQIPEKNRKANQSQVSKTRSEEKKDENPPALMDIDPYQSKCNTQLAPNHVTHFDPFSSNDFNSFSSVDFDPYSFYTHQQAILPVNRSVSQTMAPIFENGSSADAYKSRFATNGQKPIPLLDAPAYSPPALMKRKITNPFGKNSAY